MIMSPLNAINANPPNVWITYFDGFDPSTWGFVGFDTDGKRKSFLRRSQAGVLVVIAGSPQAKPEEKHQIIGVLQCSHEIGVDRDYMPSAAFADKESNPRSRGSWANAVRVVRAWEVSEDSRMHIRDFASETYTGKNGQHIGSQGSPLAISEAKRLLTMNLRETEVFNCPPIGGTNFAPAVDVLRPSRPGPTSQSPTEHREAEGPCHVYLLALSGKPGIFLNDPSARGKIIKAGFSKAPEDRREAHNRHIPVGPFQWNVLKSTAAEGRAPFPGSVQGKAAEAALIAALDRDGRSLGREFFLAEDSVIEDAWKDAIKAGEDP